MELIGMIYKVMFVWLTLGAITTAIICKWLKMNGWND